MYEIQFLLNNRFGQAWWYTPASLGSLKEENLILEANLYYIVRRHLRNKQTNKQTKRTPRK
jgi:hypothetical protein